MTDTEEAPKVPTRLDGLPNGVTIEDAKRITELANEDRRPLIHCPYTSKLRP